MIADLKIWWLLLWPKRAGLLGPRSGWGRQPLRALVFALLGVLCAVGIERLSAWFLGKCLEVELVGQFIPRKLMSLLLLVLLAVLLVSATISAFSTLFLSDDLALLVSSPVPAGPLFFARLLETMVHSSWMVFFFGIPVFIAYGEVYHSGPAFYGWMLLVLLLLIALPAGAGCIVASLLTRLFSARRSRDLLMILVVVGFVLLYLLIRALRPEQLLDEESFGGMMNFLEMFRTPDATFMPTRWAAEILFAGLLDRPLPGAELAALASSTAALLALAGWIGSSLLLPAYSRAQEGRSRLRPDRQRPRRRWLGRWLDDRARRRGLGASLLVKDLRVFLRDPNQWLQLVLLAALAAVYVLNFVYLKAANFSWFVLYTANHVLMGLVIAGISVRFVFPAVSLEGRSWWIVRAAPVRLEQFLHAKLLIHLLPLQLLAVTLAATSCLVIGVPLFFTVLSVALVMAITLGVCTLGVGLGAARPRFRVDNPAKIPTGSGGILFMLLSLGYVLTFLLASVYPTFVLRRWSRFGHRPLPRPGWLALSVLVMVVELLLISWLPMWLGRRRLERHEP